MFLVIGLGNPGKQYKDTRHNLGFLTLDKLCDTWTTKEKFKAEISKIQIKDNEVVLAKPLTYMNLSGESVSKLISFYKITDLIVVHDDMDLDIGILKISQNKNSGGHKGVQSIIDNLGNNKFTRIRIGIGKSENNTESFVLGTFAKKEEDLIKEQTINASQAIKDLISTDYNTTANKYN